MSTQANPLNQSERGGLLNLSQVSSARDVKRAGYPAQGGNDQDLLPIDEDVDEQHCSPIKPNKRTIQDSPFKRFQSGEGVTDGNHEKPLTISSVINSGNDDIAVGGFGLELDSNNMRSLNLDSGLATPSKTKKHMSSPLKHSR